jgi:hypothetical protein
MIRLSAIFLLLLGALARAADEPLPPGILYKPAGQETAQWLIKFDKYGDPMDDVSPPSDDAGRAMASKLSGDPLLEGAVFDVKQGPGAGRRFPVSELLDIRIENYTLDEKDSKKTLTSSEKPICGRTRDTLGKLLYCLKSTYDHINGDIAQVEGRLKSGAPFPAKTRALLEDILKQQKEMRERVGASTLALIDYHGIPRGALIVSTGAGSSGGGVPGSFKAKANTGGSPLHQTSKKSSPLAYDFLNCFWAVDKAPFAQPDAVECLVKGTELEPFSDKLKYFFMNVTPATFVQGYVEILRMTAIGRLLDSNAMYTGTALDTPACAKNFGWAFEKFGKGPKPPLKTKDPAYREGIKKSATKVQAALDAVAKLEKFYAQCLKRVPAGRTSVCVKTEEQEAAKAEIERIKAAILREMGGYPHLMAGAKKKVFDDLKYVSQFAKPGLTDDELDKLFEKSAPAVSRDMQTAADKFCKGDNTDWEDLIMMPELTDFTQTRLRELLESKDLPMGDRLSLELVLDRMKDVQRCAQVEYKMRNDDPAKVMVKIMAGVGCGLGSLGPQAIIVGPACAAAFLGTAVYDYSKANDKLKFTKACLASVSTDADPIHTSVCTASEYEGAAAAYDAAVTEVYLNGAFAAVEVVGIGLAIKHVVGLRALAAEATIPADLETASRGMRAASSIDEAESVAATARTSSKASSEAMAVTRERYAKTALQGVSKAQEGKAIELIEIFEKRGIPQNKIERYFEKLRSGCRI